MSTDSINRRHVGKLMAARSAALRRVHEYEAHIRTHAPEQLVDRQLTDGLLSPDDWASLAAHSGYSPEQIKARFIALANSSAGKRLDHRKPPQSSVERAPLDGLTASFQARPPIPPHRKRKHKHLGHNSHVEAARKLLTITSTAPSRPTGSVE